MVHASWLAQFLMWKHMVPRILKVLFHSMLPFWHLQPPVPLCEAKVSAGLITEVQDHEDPGMEAQNARNFLGPVPSQQKACGLSSLMDHASGDSGACLHKQETQTFPACREVP